MTQPAATPPAAADPTGQPQNSALIRQIVDLLLISAGVAATASAMATLLAPLGLGAKAVGAATRLALSVAPGNIDPVGMPGSVFGANRSDGKASRNTSESEVFYRAAYLLNAAKRIERSLHQGQPIMRAVRDERRYFNQHRDAQSRRAEAARQVDVAAQVFGDLLGWHAVNDNRTSAECKAANGRNFPVDRRPAIGYPGTVHPHCRCMPGLPFEGGAMLPLSRRPPARIRKVA